MEKCACRQMQQLNKIFYKMKESIATFYLLLVYLYLLVSTTKMHNISQYPVVTILVRGQFSFIKERVRKNRKQTSRSAIDVIYTEQADVAEAALQ